MQVKDIMTKSVICVRPDNSITEVARLLTDNRIHGVPVVDGENKLTGIITESDFFIKDIPDLYLPSYIDFLKKTGFAKGISREQKKQFEELLEAKASDIMTKECFSVAPEMEVEEMLKIIKSRNYYTLPVTDKEKKVVGIVTVADVIKLL